MMDHELFEAKAVCDRGGGSGKKKMERLVNWNEVQDETGVGHGIRCFAGSICQ